MRTRALIASEPVQPLQRFLHHNLHHHGGRHLSAQCGRLTGLALLWQIFAADERDGIPKSVFQ